VALLSRSSDKRPCKSDRCSAHEGGASTRSVLVGELSQVTQPQLQDRSPSLGEPRRRREKHTQPAKPKVSGLDRSTLDGPDGSEHKRRHSPRTRSVSGTKWRSCLSPQARDHVSPTGALRMRKEPAIGGRCGDDGEWHQSDNGKRAERTRREWTIAQWD